jgi:hypothetical protein
MRQIQQIGRRAWLAQMAEGTFVVWAEVTFGLGRKGLSIAIGDDRLAGSVAQAQTRDPVQVTRVITDFVSSYVSVASTSWTSQALKPTTRCSQDIVDARVRSAMTPPGSQELWAQNGARLPSFHIAERSSVAKIARLERHGSAIFLNRTCHRVWLARYFGRF